MVTEQVVVGAGQFSTPPLSSHMVVKIFVNHKMNGVGRLENGLIKGYDGVFPSYHRDDTYVMLDYVEAQIAQGNLRDRTSIRDRNVFWRVETHRD